MKWTPEAIEFVRHRWLVEGKSASVIAAEMTGVTRNSVIGIAHRRGWPKRKTAFRAPVKARQKRANPVRAIKRASPTAMPSKIKQILASHEVQSIPDECTWRPIDGAEPVPLMRLEPQHCRWPIDGAVPLFCGCTRIPGTSYCASHVKLAFVAAAPRRKAPIPLYQADALTTVKELTTP